MNKKLRIAIIGSRGYPYVYSGYETLVKELSERISKKGHHVRVYCHRPLFKKRPKVVNGVELVYMPAIETKVLSQFINSIELEFEISLKVTFLKISEELFSACKSEFKNLEYFYFHNIIYETVWKDNRRRHNERIKTEDVIHKYASD